MCLERFETEQKKLVIVGCGDRAAVETARMPRDGRKSSAMGRTNVLIYQLVSQSFFVKSLFIMGSFSVPLSLGWCIR